MNHDWRKGNVPAWSGKKHGVARFELGYLFEGGYMTCKKNWCISELWRFIKDPYYSFMTGSGTHLNLTLVWIANCCVRYHAVFPYVFIISWCHECGICSDHSRTLWFHPSSTISVNRIEFVNLGHLLSFLVVRKNMPQKPAPRQMLCTFRCPGTEVRIKGKDWVAHL